MDAVSPSSPKSSIHPVSRLRARGWAYGLIVLSCLLLSGCPTQAENVKEAFGKTMAAVGLKQGEAKPIELPLRLYAGDNLNSGDSTRAAALVVRVYQLRSGKRFEEAAFDVFLDEQRERDVLGDDLISVTEFLLTPGKRHEVVETLPLDGTHLGVVSLFRVPAANRWRFTFDAKQAASEGITIGLHGCAMTTASPALTTKLSSPSHNLSSSQCAPARR